MAVKTKDINFNEINFSNGTITLNAKGLNAIYFSDISEDNIEKNISLSIENGMLKITKDNKTLFLTNYSGIKYIKTDYSKNDNVKTYSLTDIISNSLIDNSTIVSTYNEKKLAVTGTTNYNDTINVSEIKNLTKIAKVNGIKQVVSKAETDKGFTIDSKKGNDNIVGSMYSDTIKSGDGNDTIFAGKGNDVITSGKGNDTFIFTANDGINTLKDADNFDTIQITDLNAEDLTFGKNGNNLEIYYDNSFDENNKIVIQNYFKKKEYQRISNLSLDKDLINISYITNNQQYSITGKGSIKGSNYSDKIIGSNSKDNIKGNNGNDTIYGRNGNDVIYGGNGSDIFFGGNDNDTIRCGADKNIIYGEKGNDVIYGESGYNVMYFQEGDGQDKIYMGKNTDIIVFDKQLEDSIKYEKNGNHLVIKYGEQNDSVSIMNYFKSNYISISRTVFADYNAQTIYIDELNDATTSYLSTNIKMYGYHEYWDFYPSIDPNQYITLDCQILNGNDNNNLIIGSKKYDVINPGSGNDTVYMNSKIGSIDDISGDDKYIISSLKNGTILTDNGGNDEIFINGSYKDVNFIFDVARNDNYNAFDANNLYIFNDSSVKKLAKTKNLIVTSGIQIDDYFKDGNIEKIGTKDCYITNAEIEKITTNVKNWLQKTGYNTALEALIYASKPLQNELLSIYANIDWIKYEIKGTSKNDYLVGTDYDESIYGAKGNDTIIAKNGNDYIDGGIGNDYIQITGGHSTIIANDGDDTIIANNGNSTIYGGKGNDHIELNSSANRIIVNKGDGIDEIISNNEENIIEFSVKQQIKYYRIYGQNDLIIKYTDSDHILLKNYFQNNNFSETKIRNGNEEFTIENEIKEKLVLVINKDAEKIQDYTSNQIYDLRSSANTIYFNVDSGDDIVYFGNNSQNIEIIKDEKYGDQKILFKKDGNDILIIKTALNGKEITSEVYTDYAGNLTLNSISHKPNQQKILYYNENGELTETSTHQEKNSIVKETVYADETGTLTKNSYDFIQVPITSVEKSSDFFYKFEIDGHTLYRLNNNMTVGNVGMISPTAMYTDLYIINGGTVCSLEEVKVGDFYEDIKNNSVFSSTVYYDYAGNLTTEAISNVPNEIANGYYLDKDGNLTTEPTYIVNNDLADGIFYLDINGKILTEPKEIIDTIRIVDGYSSILNNKYIIFNNEKISLENISIEINGSNDNDIIQGSYKNEILIGGKGNNELNGRDGDDTYIVSLALDSYNDINYEWGGNDKVIIENTKENVALYYQIYKSGSDSSTLYIKDRNHLTEKHGIEHSLFNYSEDSIIETTIINNGTEDTSDDYIWTYNESQMNKITSEVASWLNKNNYYSVENVIDSGNESDINAVLAIFDQVWQPVTT